MCDNDLFRVSVCLSFIFNVLGVKNLSLIASNLFKSVASLGTQQNVMYVIGLEKMKNTRTITINKLVNRNIMEID